MKKMWNMPSALRRPEEDQFDRDLANWIFDSHNWQEYYPGQFECLWCGQRASIYADWCSEKSLCRKNPEVKKLLKLCAEDKKEE
jgi:hypothetical protein